MPRFHTIKSDCHKTRDELRDVVPDAAFQARAVLEPLIQQNDDKHRRHHKIQPFQIKREEPAEKRAECGAGNPVQLVQQRHPEVKPAPVHPFRYLRPIIDGKCLIAGRVNQIEFLPSRIAVLRQHRQAVEQMPGAHHEGRGHGRNRMKGRGQDLDHQKLHGSGVDHRGRQRRKPEREPGRFHQQPIGDSQEHIPRHDRNGKREAGPQSLKSPARLAFPF